MKNKIYVRIPVNTVAGGVESLYQLVDAINNTTGNAYIVFDYLIDNPIPEKYLHYNVKYTDNVEDFENNYIIYPEVWTQLIGEFKNLKNCIWWLSVDNNDDKFKDFQNPNIYHFYQSNYALIHLLNNKAKNYMPLFDYISPKYLDTTFDISKKENMVCYNPAKGMEITNEIIVKNSNVKFVPISGMSENQIIDLLKISKIYIDFGKHPGKDRIPRETAWLGNCVITNKKGSAYFYNDVPVNDNYKTEDIDILSNLIQDCFNNYEKHINNFSIYRSSIKNQKEQLYNQVKQLFNES
jgi:hypothetical protein